MTESTEFPQGPAEALPPKVQKAYENAIIAYKIARDKFYANVPREEIKKEAEIVRKSLNKIRLAVLEIHGKNSLDYVDWVNVDVQATIENDKDFIWYLPKRHVLIKAPEKREKRDGVPFAVPVPDVQDKPIEADKTEWILKGSEIARTLERFATTQPPKPEQKTLDI